MSRSWMGFDDRVFLTDAEHETYLRRPPVRYARGEMPEFDGLCQICKQPPTTENPIQAAHRIPFLKGVQRHRLTPEWLDRAENLVWAHRSVCNKAAEWTDEQTRLHLAEIRKREEHRLRLAPENIFEQDGRFYWRSVNGNVDVTDTALWWQCPSGHEWQATLSVRTTGAGCPKCVLKNAS